MFKKIAAVLFYSILATQALGQASLLPNAKQTFVDPTGAPLASGTVDLYVPNTNTRKNTWTNSTEGSLNTNPIALDAAGRAIIYGQGSYRQVVKDAAGNTQWDALTMAPSSGTATFLTDAAPVGTLLALANTNLPTNYLWASGQQVSRTTYATLFDAITYSQTAVTVSGSTTLSSMSGANHFKVGASIEGACLPFGVVVSSVVTNSSITVSSAATSTGSCAVRVIPYGAGNGSTTFNIPDMRGRTATGEDAIGGAPAGILTSTYCTGSSATLGVGSSCGTQSHTMLLGEIAAHAHPSSTLTDPGHGHFLVNTDAFTGTIVAPTSGNFISKSASDSTNFAYAINGTATVASLGRSSTATTGITLSTNTGSTGSATPFSVIQPVLLINWVIKYQESTPSGAGGVISIGGMTGDILCGANVLCTAQTISFTGLGSGDVVGPTSAVDSNIVLFDTTTGRLIKDGGGGAPSFPVKHPSAGYTLECAQGHFLWWVDQNICSTADTLAWNSSDPSALFQQFVVSTSGLVGGETFALTFKFGSGPCVSSGAGCTVSVTAIGADTPTTLARKLIVQISNTVNLWAGTALQPDTSCPASDCGGPPGPVLAMSDQGGGAFGMDFNSGATFTPVSITAAVSAHGAIATPAGCSSACTIIWDVNPQVSWGRFVSGTYPNPNSQLAAFIFTSNHSANLTGQNQQYGQINVTVLNGVAGSIASRIGINTPNTAGSISQGIYIGGGLYTVDTNDQGLGTINAGVCVWLGGLDSVCNQGGSFNVTARGSQNMILTSDGTTNVFVRPTNGGSDGWIFTPSGGLRPENNNVVTLGDASHAISSTYQYNSVLMGSTSGSMLLEAAAVAGSNIIRFPSGTTDFSATGGTSQVVKQTSAGGAFTVARLACADLSDSSTGCSAASGITALTGDVTATGPGSVAATLATTQPNAHTWSALQTFSANIISPVVIGGTTTTSALALRSTSGAGTTGADIIFQTGNNGATEAMRITNAGIVGIKTTTPNIGGFGGGQGVLTIAGTAGNWGTLEFQSPSAGTNSRIASIVGYNSSTELARIEIITDASGSTNGDTTFRNNGAETARIFYNGSIQFNTYAAGCATFSSTGVISSTPGCGQGAISDTVNAITTTYTVLNSDNGKTISASANAYYTITLNAATGYDTTYCTRIFNADTWGSGRGKLIAPNGLTSFRLWPQQTVDVCRNGSAWVYYKAPLAKLGSGTVSFQSDYTNGSDSTAVDCLGTGAAACKSVEYAYYMILDQFAFDGTSSGQTQAGINMAASTKDAQCLHASARGYNSAQGGMAIMVIGTTGSEMTCSTKSTVETFVGTTLYFKGVTFTNTVAASGGNCVVSHDGSHIYLEDPKFANGTDGCGSAEMSSDNGFIDWQGTTVTVNAGSSNYFMVGTFGGKVATNGVGVSFSANKTYTATILGADNAIFKIGSTVWTLNAHTITGQRFSLTNGALIDCSCSASLTAIPGSTAGSWSGGANYDGLLGINTFAGQLTYTGITTDATHTDRTVCEDTTSNVLLFGSGAAGICLGTSSARFKTNIVDLSPGLAEVLQLRPVSYRYKASHGDPDKDLFGFIAEDVVNVMPKLVGLDAEGRPNSVDWAGVVPVLVKAIQELKADNDNLRQLFNQRRAAN